MNKKQRQPSYVRQFFRRNQSSSTKIVAQSREAVLVIIASLSAQAAAQKDAAVLAETSQSNRFERIWSLPILYQDTSNPYLQEFKLRGRYQGRHWDVDADQGSEHAFSDRRSRFGFDAKLFDKKIDVRVDFQSNENFDDIYDGLVDAYIAWKPTPDLRVTAGKTKPFIAHYDWLQSTNSQPTFERSQVFNQLAVNRATALTLEGSKNQFSWRTGIYANDTPANTADSGALGDGEFGNLNGGYSFSAGAGYDFKKQLNLDKADLRVDWLHSEREADEDLVLNRYADLVSATLWLQKADAALVFESYFASGGDGDDSNVFGFFIQPTYDLIPEKLQLVGRYSFAQSTGARGLRVQSRYEGQVAQGGRGDHYQSLYAGAQYFIHGDNLKLMAGAEYAWLDGESDEVYDGLTLLNGIRFSF